LNAIWEGTSNMMTMDLDRVLDREPKTYRVLLDEIALGAGAHPDLDRAIAALEDADPSGRARRQPRAEATLLSLALQASLLCRRADPPIADAFCATRLGVDRLPGFGTADLADSQTASILDSFR
jgi:putative acyl-CoA dehydrogenase